MLPCHKCGSLHARRSRTRNTWERVYRALSGKRPFRCQACNWRGWRVDPSPFYDYSQEPAINSDRSEREPLDLDALTIERLRGRLNAVDPRG